MNCGFIFLSFVIGHIRISMSSSKCSRNGGFKEQWIFDVSSAQEMCPLSFDVPHAQELLELPLWIDKQSSSAWWVSSPLNSP